jgi:hypothetical protein
MHGETATNPGRVRLAYFAPFSKAGQFNQDRNIRQSDPFHLGMRPLRVAESIGKPRLFLLHYKDKNFLRDLAHSI